MVSILFQPRRGDSLLTLTGGGSVYGLYYRRDMAPSTGFEPALTCFEGKCLSPLDEDGIGGPPGN
jgi:hypothetical protein